MNNLKRRICSTLVAIASSVSMFSIMPITNVSATTIYVKEGDVNNDGSTSVTDAVITSKYLHGSVSCSEENITRMDATREGIIDYQDYNFIINCIIGYETPQTYYQTVYDPIIDESRTYYKYSYSNGSAVGSPTEYTLNVPGDGSNMREALDRTTPNFIRDYTNISTVRIFGNIDNTYFSGSGFIIDDHVVATCVHCVALGTSNNISVFNNLKVRVYDSTESTYIDYNIDSVHVPKSYFPNNSNIEPYNEYDYALIHIDSQYDNDSSKTFSQYDPYNIGYMTSKFFSDQGTITTSGYTTDPNNQTAGTHRYYSQGTVYNNPTANKYGSYACANNGDSGGIAYYNSNYNNSIIKSAVGNINSRGYANYNLYETFGCRMTPTLARFYLHNSNI